MVMRVAYHLGVDGLVDGVGVRVVRGTVGVLMLLVMTVRVMLLLLWLSLLWMI